MTGDNGGGREARLSVAGVAVFYVLLAGAGLLWIHVRDRLEPFMEERLVGTWGLPLSVLAGVGVAVVAAVLSQVLVRRVAVARRLEHALAELLGPLNERQIVVLALFSGVGEEIFFRGAMQDALGLWVTSVVFALLHTGRGRHFLLWTALSFAIGLVLGLLVEAGSGLLTVTLAHALINYLNLGSMNVRRAEGA